MCNYVDLLEDCIPCNLFVFTDVKSIGDEINVYLSKLAGTVIQSYKNVKGRAGKELDEKVKKILSMSARSNLKSEAVSR